MSGLKDVSHVNMISLGYKPPAGRSHAYFWPNNPVINIVFGI